MSSPQPDQFTSGALLVPTTADTTPAGIDLLNSVLEEEGLGRPIGPVTAVSSKFAVLPVTADAAVVRDALLRASRERGVVVPALKLDREHGPGTELGLVLYGAGRRWGHGMEWVDTLPLSTPDRPRWRPIGEVPGGRRPVVALLDTTIREHPWLDAPDDDPILLRVDGPAWSPSVPISEVTTDSLGSHYCHATFIAGLIRIGAPDAQVLPIRVMSDAGAVSETNVIDALTWLMARMDSGQVVDVVNMSFGRPKDNGDDDDLPALRGVITRLHQRGVRVVVSAGNGHSSVPNVPGSFAAETGAPVVSVGAGVGPVESQRAPFSNYGDWVHAWRVGTDVISINPIPQSDGALGFAQWSGTSFSAAIVTGEFAQEVVDRAEQPVRPSAP